MNALLIGFGNLGKRHFQALASSHLFSRIHIIDQYQNADTLRDQTQRISIKLNQEFECFNYEDYIVDQCDYKFAIDSQLSPGRLARYINLETPEAFYILEKTIAPSYDEMVKHIANIDLSTDRVFVHCPRQMWPAYEAIKCLLFSNNLSCQTVFVKLCGFDIISNLIHFIALYDFLVGLDKVSSIKINRAKNYASNKRIGYREGEIEADISFGSDNHLIIDTMLSTDQPKLDIIIYDKSGRIVVEYNEISGVIKYSPDFDKVFKYMPPYVSEYYAHFGPILNGSKTLPTLRQSINHHSITFQILNNAFGDIPIT